MTVLRAGILLGILTVTAHAEDVPLGKVIDAVKCAADSAQSYALYLPSNYSEKRTWPVLFAFDPGARGKIPVERFREAAEKYGYIVAGSNNSRNGSMGASLAAAQAMVNDAGRRFAIDSKRIYLTGMSGGARVAMQVALGSGTQIAGVVAASAGFPAGEPRKSVPFGIFGTAGTEDFNYLEMRELDAAVTSPHRLAIFEGGHGWMPAELTFDAIEWMEIQAMKSGRRSRDAAIVDAIFARRREQAEKLTNEADAFRAFESLAVDFTGLRDVAEVSARASSLRKKKEVREALKREHADEEKELRTTAQLLELERGLGDPANRPLYLAQLQGKLADIQKQANAPDDSDERRVARRLLRGTLARARENMHDAEYQKLITDLRK